MIAFAVAAEPACHGTYRAEHCSDRASDGADCLPVHVSTLAADANSKLRQRRSTRIGSRLAFMQTRHGDGVTAGGVKQQRLTERKSGRPDLHPWRQGYLGVSTDSRAMRGSQDRWALQS